MSWRGDSPRGREATDTSAATAIPAILVLLAAGLALRLIIAYVIFPGSGFPNDLDAFQYWGNDIARNGPIGFYDRQSFIDYPPVYLLLLGLVSLLTGGSIGEGVKILPILADLALAGVVWTMVQELGGSSRRALIAAAIVLFNPITWFNSAIWGQADAVGSIFLLLGLRELQRDRREIASGLAVLAVLTKMQLGILGFVVGFVVLRRSLAPRKGDRDPARVLTSVGAGLVTGAAVCLPFTGLDFAGLAQRLSSAAGLLTLAVGLVTALGVFALARRYLPPAEAARRTLESALLGVGTAVVFAGMVFDSIASHLINTFGEYPYLTLNAYNPWALVTSGAGEAMDRGLSWIRDAPFTDPQTGQTQPGFVFGPFSATFVIAALGLAVLLALGAVVAWTRARAMGRAMAPAGQVEANVSAAAGEAIEPEESRDWASELRGLGAACAVAAAAIAFVVGGQLIAPLYALVVGDAFLIAILVCVAVWAAWRDDRISLLVALAILAIAFFVVPTRAHERYLFPFFGLGAILLALSWRWTVAYVALAAVNSLNLLAVLTQYKGIPATDGMLAGTLIDWGNGLRTATWFDGIVWPIALSAVVTGLALLWALLQMRGVSVARLAREAAAAGEAPAGDAAAEEAPVREPAAGETEGVPTTPLAAGEGPLYAPGGSYDFDRPEEWADEDYLDEADRPDLVPPWIMSIWRRLYRPSSHPDRSASLDAEPRGRLDRLDLWVVVALAVAILSLRVYRLDEPTQMYFDEVYHARTATEFLQDWRYNIPYNLPGNYIYEWTHPHLAKYAIAGGITLFSDDKVVSTSKIGVNVTDVAVEPRLPTSPLADASNPDDPRSNQAARFGDRVFVATGADVRVYDLESRALVHTYAIPGASSLSSVGPSGMLYVGTAQGRLWQIDTNSLDDVRLGLAQAAKPATELDAQTGFDVVNLYAGTPPLLLAVDASGNVASIDLSVTGGQLVAKALIPGAADFADLGTGPASLTVVPGKVGNAASEAQLLASDGAGDAAALQSAMLAATSGLEAPLRAGPPLSAEAVASIQTQIQAGQLPGVVLTASNPQAMVAYSKGIGLLDARHLIINTTLSTDHPATSIAVNPNKDQASYVTAGSSVVLIRVDTTGTTGSVTLDLSQPLRKMPGPVTKVFFDSATKIVQVLGRTPDGQNSTVYAIESNGNAVFSDARLPFQPVAMGLDSSPQLPDSNREQLLAFSPDGSIAAVDVGQFAFSWRIVGVLFGALMAVCLYLLARILFRRRSIGLLVALFSAVDGLLFAQSRIAMNDTYVGGFLLLGYLLFALIWLNVWKSRLAFWLGMPLLGVILGLALVSKWVGLYAMASIGILILIRSALGRVIVILGLAAATGILGWQAISEMSTQPNTGDPVAVVLLLALGALVVVGGAIRVLVARTTPDKVFMGLATGVIAALILGAALSMSPSSFQNGAPNYTFFIIMMAVTASAAAANAYHPIAWTREELWFATVGPGVAGVAVAALGFALEHGLLGGELSGFLTAQGGPAVKVGVGLVGLGIAAAAAFWLAGLLGFGPLAKARGEDDPARFAAPPSPAPTGWLRLGSGFGLPAVWMTACVMVLPIVVYVLMYLPWSMPWQPQTADTGNLPAIACWHVEPGPQPNTTVCTDAWPAGHTGQTLWDLTISMYNYHNTLRQPHAASSPWWAWPMDLKPVWFESIGYASDQGSMIYDGGNPALWWMAIFAMAFICWQAFKRRSLGLALIVVAFFWQWLSWSRIDRASFQYHFYTALPFFLLGLAYFLAELWHGPSRRTWLLARVAAAAALLFPTAVWALRSPLCGLARVSTADYYGNTACGVSTGDVRIDTRIFLIGVVLIASLAALALVLLRLERRQARGEEDPAWVLQLLVPVAIAGALLWWLGQNAPQDLLFRAALPSDMIILLLLPVLALLAAIALRAQNPRRFVLAVCAVAIAAFLALYPNLSALPMPNNITGVYNGLLPTWLYGFQFSVNQQEGANGPLISLTGLECVALALVVAVIAGWAAWERRLVLGYRRAGSSALGTGEMAAPGGGSGAIDAPSEVPADAFHPSGDES